ncbi:unnamed protein product [Paramecium pentaurelia]|uniref:Uncharacterized protein n=1 Tax=Paramecium pentaurelia TaxID=43138 RepID=A0A8S1UUZ7_9CILI|nr:unnamed protein product [Paramecium pentaurelia]
MIVYQDCIQINMDLTKIQINNLEVQIISIVLKLKNYHCEQSTLIDQNIYFNAFLMIKTRLHPKNWQNSYGDCIISQIQEQNQQENNLVVDIQNSELILFLDLTDLTQLKLNNLISSQINCKFRQFIKIIDFQSQNYQFSMWIIFKSEKQNSTDRRLLTQTEVNIYQRNLEVFIDNYICQYNIANNGTCLFIENAKVLIYNSIFQYNKASETGGAIFVNNKKDILITSSVISLNSAFIGGGIYLINQQDLDYVNLNTIVNNNQAQIFGQNILSVPQKLTITLQYESSKLSAKSIIISQDLSIFLITLILNKLILMKELINQPAALTEQQILLLIFNSQNKFNINHQKLKQMKKESKGSIKISFLQRRLQSFSSKIYHNKINYFYTNKYYLLMDDDSDSDYSPKKNQIKKQKALKCKQKFFIKIIKLRNDKLYMNVSHYQLNNKEMQINDRGFTFKLLQGLSLKYHFLKRKLKITLICKKGSTQVIQKEIQKISQINLILEKINQLLQTSGYKNCIIAALLGVSTQQVQSNKFIMQMASQKEEIRFTNTEINWLKLQAQKESNSCLFNAASFRKAFIN